MAILAQFLLRLTFGLAVGMGITSSQKVFSGFFRNHLYVTLGLTTFAAFVFPSWLMLAKGFAIAAAVVSFLGAAAWLYESKRFGKLLIWFVAIFSAASAELFLRDSEATVSQGVTNPVAVVTSGLVLGMVFAAMLLGHWYLNAPGMELAPLRRLLIASAIAVAVQMVVVGAGLAAEISHRPDVPAGWMLFVTLRWSFGLLFVMGLLWMAWQTLKIPNTQSATGILYVAVIGVFIGELTGLLLSAESAFPL